MKLTRLLTPDLIIDLGASDKDGALREMAEIAGSSPRVVDRNAFVKSILDREAVLSTGIGLGIAVPHAKVSAVKDFVVAIGRSKAGIDWDSLDGKPVNIVVMIGANEKQTAEYTRVLAEVVTRVKGEEVRKRLMSAAGAAEIFQILSE